MVFNKLLDQSEIDEWTGRKAKRKLRNSIKTSQRIFFEARTMFDSDETIPILTDEIALYHQAIGDPVPQPKKFINYQRENTKISIVISHCEDPIGWLSDFIDDNFVISDITIISKCGKDIQGIHLLHKLTKEIKVDYLDNVGRSDHSYAYWISQNRPKISRDDTGNGLVLFMKDNNYLLPCCRTFEEVFQLATVRGFGCFLRPHPGKMMKNLYIPLMYHRTSRLDGFALSKYDRTGDESNPDFSSQYENLKAFRTELGFDYPDTPLVPVCYGGMFMTQKKGLLTQPQHLFENLEVMLSRGNNIEEGHFVERLWASLVTGQSEVSMQRFSKQILPKIQYEECLTMAFLGMTYARMYETYPKQKHCIGIKKQRHQSNPNEIN